jgi:hypothetical protein
MVLETDCGENRRHDIVLLYQLSTVHDDDFRHRRVVLPESVLSRFANGVWPSCGEATPAPTPLIARIALGPVIAATGEQMHGGAVPAHDQPIAVVLDLVHPVGSGGRLDGKRGDAGGDKSVGAGRASGRAGEITACCEPAQP